MHTNIVASLEFSFLVDRAIAACQAGRKDVADVFARAAEGLLTKALPQQLGAVVSKTASRKGNGSAVAGMLAQRLPPSMAGAVLVIWMLRGARQPAIQTLATAFSADAECDVVVRSLCRRLFSSPPTTATAQAFEVAAPRVR